MLKKLLVVGITICSLFACLSEPTFEKADNPLDAGRYFLESCLQGEFKKAHFYVLMDSQNQTLLNQISAKYYQLDKEGRQQYRQASIQINEIKSITDSISTMQYKLSYEKIPNQITIHNTEKGWKVDLKDK